MDSDENNQNLDLRNEKDSKENQDSDQSRKAEEGRFKSIADSKTEDNAKEQQSKSKNPSKIPVKVIVPAVILIIAVISIAIFIIHPVGKTTLSTVTYTPINYLSNSGLNSAIGGNWSLVLNETANSTVISRYAGTGDFPAGTVAASVQEFVPFSEISQLHANNSSNISDFVSTVYYMNSSSSASALFDEIGGITGSEYTNNSKVEYNLSNVENVSMFYVNGRLNSSNSSTENATEIYMLKGKSLVIATASNKNINYSKARNIVTDLFA